MKNVKELSACLAAIVLVACGSSDSGTEPQVQANEGILEQNINTPDSSVNTPVMPPLFVLDLLQNADDSIIASNVEFTPQLSNAYRPIGDYAGEYMAMAYAADELVDAVPIHFPKSYLSESFDENLEYIDSNSGTLDESFTRITIDATRAVDRIDIIDQSMKIVTSITDLPVAQNLSTRSSQPFSRYSWIDLMDETDSARWQDSVADVFNIVGLTTAEIAYVESILDLLPKRLVSAIDSLAFGTLRKPGLTMGGYVLINHSFLSSEPGRLFHLIAHEAGHAYHNASAYVDGGANYADWLASWPTETQQEITQTHEEFGFERDLLNFWGLLQFEAVRSGTADAYTGDPNISIPFPHRHGFVNSYAASRIDDDIADTIAIANMRITNTLSPGISSSACTYYKGTPELSRVDAMAYLKLRLVEALGLAESIDVEWCVGNASPTLVDGIQLGDALSFDRQLNAGYTSEARENFNIVGQDPMGRGLAIELATNGKSPPIGIYPLDSTWWRAWDGDNTLVIASPDDFEARTGLTGTVVVTYAKSGERVDGFVLDLRLANAFGLASEFPYVPFRIPLD